MVFMAETYRALFSNVTANQKQTAVRGERLGGAHRNQLVMWPITNKKCRSREVIVKQENITDIATYLRLCDQQHKRRYVAMSVMFSCFTITSLERHFLFVIGHITN